MDYRGPSSQRRRCRRLLVVGVCVPTLLGVVAVCLGVAFSGTSTNPPDFRTQIVSKCKTFVRENGRQSSENKCEEVWDVFSGAYVGKDPCDVSMEAYDPLIEMAYQISPPSGCDQTLFWSKTKEFVRQVTQDKKCPLTQENLLPGFMIQDQTWCSKKGSTETFTTGCPGWVDCEKNPVRSFWNRASAAFSEFACGEVAVMLNGSISTPFNNNSVLATIEIERFHPPKVKSVKVILVTAGNDTETCENASLQALRAALDPALQYTCTVVPSSKTLECTSDPDKPCGACW